MNGEHKRLALLLFHAMADGDAATIDRVLAPNYDHHGALPLLRGRVLPAREFRRYFAGPHHAFPDFQNTAEDVLAEGDEVAVRWTARGTHRGAFLGVAATGKQITWSGVTIVRIQAGQIVEGWWTVDALDARLALGLVRKADVGTAQ